MGGGTKSRQSNLRAHGPLNCPVVITRALWNCKKTRKSWSRQCTRPQSSRSSNACIAKLQEKHEKMLKSVKYCVHCCALLALFGAPGVEICALLTFIFKEYIFFYLFSKKTTVHRFQHRGPRTVPTVHNNAEDSASGRHP